MVLSGWRVHDQVMAAPGRHIDRNRPRCRALGAASWLLLLLLLVQALGRDGAPAATMLAIAPAALVLTYGITRAWVWHNKHLYRVKGPRRSRPVLELPWTHDRLGRQLLQTPWPGREVALATNGSVKTYR